MAVYSHKYRIETRTLPVEGEMGMKSGQTFSTTRHTNTDDLTATQITAIGTFLTAVNTLKTALGELNSIHITPTSQSTVGKV